MAIGIRFDQRRDRALEFDGSLHSPGVHHRHRNDDLTGSAQPVDGQQSEVRRAVEQHDVIAVDVPFEGAAQKLLAADLCDQ
jgi:hypothetical protein